MPLFGMALTIRLSEDLQTRSVALAKSLGIPLNSLIAVALADYLAARSRAAASVLTPPNNAVELAKSLAVGDVPPAVPESTGEPRRARGDRGTRERKRKR